MSKYSKRARREVVSVAVVAILAFVIFIPIAAVFIPTAAATNHVVDMVDYNFSPKFIPVAPGDTITWHNAGTILHTATSNTSAWAEVIVSPNMDSAPITMPTTPGNYTYICSIHFATHNTMWGAIVVSTDIPEFSSSLVVVMGMLAIALGLMLIRRV